MAMLDIEYRFSDEPIDAEGIRRKTTKDMEFYIRGLVFEMQSADISVKFRTAVPAEGERNMVYINGKSVPDILEGLYLFDIDQRQGFAYVSEALLVLADPGVVR